MYAVFGVVGTFFFIVVVGGFLYLAIELIRTIRGFRQSVDSATQALQVIGPLLKSEELVRLSNALVLMGKLGTQMLQKMEALDKTIGLFYNFAVARGELDASARVGSTSEVAPTGGGRFFQHSEERAAAREAAAEQEEERVG